MIEPGLCRIQAGNPSLCQELIMSARNGDKSRCNRDRHQKMARRTRTQGILQRLASAHSSAGARAGAGPEAVAA